MHEKNLDQEIKAASSLYRGFFIDKAQGNNRFSFSERKNKRIYVAPLNCGTVDDLATGQEIAFSEIDEDREVSRPGLKKFIYYPFQDKHIFIFDNHNHAFFFWILGLRAGLFARDRRLAHIDQHTDMREPPDFPDNIRLKALDLNAAFEYTNFYLNVGNFIRPALDLNLFKDIDSIDSSYAFENPLPENYILDLDMDIFSEDMAYIDYDKKLSKIREYIEKTRFITIATSPYFMDQARALTIIRQLFD